MVDIKENVQAEEVTTEETVEEEVVEEVSIESKMDLMVADLEKVKSSYDEHRVKYDKLKTNYDKATAKIDELSRRGLTPEEIKNLDKDDAQIAIEQREAELSKREADLVKKQLVVSFTESLVFEELDPGWSKVIDVDSSDSIKEKIKTVKSLILTERKAAIKDGFKKTAKPAEGKTTTEDRPFKLFAQK